MSIIKANQWQNSAGTVYNIPIQTVYNNFRMGDAVVATNADLNWTSYNISTTTVTSKAPNSIWIVSGQIWATSRNAGAMSFDIWVSVNGGAYSTFAGQYGSSSAMESSGSFGIACLWDQGSTDNWQTIPLSASNQITAAAGSTLAFRYVFRNGGPGTDLSQTANGVGHGIATGTMHVTEVRTY